VKVKVIQTGTIQYSSVCRLPCMHIRCGLLLRNLDMASYEHSTVIMLHLVLLPRYSKTLVKI